MKKLLLLSLISTPALANWASGPTSAAYADQETCQLKEVAKCYFLDPAVDRSVTEIKQVEVDDLLKPIYDFKDSKDGVCPETEKDSGIFYEYIKNDESKRDCRLLLEYEKRLEDQLVVDIIKEGIKEDEKAAADAAALIKKNQIDALRVKINNNEVLNNTELNTVLKHLLN